MIVIVHDHFKGTAEQFSGDENTVRKALLATYPWVHEVEGEPLNELLEYIDGHHGLSVETEGYFGVHLTPGDHTEPSPITKSERNLEGKHLSVAQDMLGFRPQLHSAFEAARFMSGGPVLSINQMRRALYHFDGDMDKAALYAYGIEVTPENLATMLSVRQLHSLGKMEPEFKAPQHVEPALMDAQQTAEQVSRAVKGLNVHSVNLGGKHSDGTLLAQDPETHEAFLLKPGSHGPGPAAGAREESATQSAREACFYHVAEALGMQSFVPHADLLIIDGQQVAAIHLLPWNYKNLDKAMKSNQGGALGLLNRYLSLGILHKWAVLDFILGNPDRHGQNVMVGDDGRMYLIDHGSAFAGHSFDPAYDRNSFVPYYLRAWSLDSFNRLSPKERLRRMPRLSEQAEKGFEQWINGIDEHRLHDVLSRYGIDPDPTISRLARLKMSSEAKDLAICRLWVGA